MSADDDLKEAMAPLLKDLPAALDAATFTLDAWPFVLDTPERQSSRFLQYQAGAMLSAMRPDDMDKERLRYALVQTLKNGTTLTIDFAGIDFNLDLLFTDGFFPRSVLDKGGVFDESFWGPLLRPDEGDPPATQFEAKGSFRLVFVCERPEGGIEALHEGLKGLAAQTAIIRVKLPGDAGGGADGDGGGDPSGGVAGLYGVKIIKRNSEDMVEDAFEGELDKVKEYLEKGFDLESTDGHQNTALCEAASQGHMETVMFLLGEGADPNAANDEGKTPLFRASYNGRHEMVIALLKAGADPDLKTKGAEAPTHVAKTDETREFIDAWDRQVVLKLKEERDAIIAAKLDARIKTAAEREAHARDKIRNDLVAAATAGDVDGLEALLTALVQEAEKDGAERPRGTAEARDDRGQTLLMAAAQQGHTAMVDFLLHKLEKLKKEAEEMGFGSFGGGLDGETTMEEKVFRVNAKARDPQGWTPASVAAFHGQKAALKLILDAGGDPLVKNVHKKNAFDVVKTEKDLLGAVLKAGNPELEEMLNQWLADKELEKVGLDPEAAKAAAEAKAAADAAAATADGAEGGGAEKAEGGGAAGGTQKKKKGGGKGGGKKGGGGKKAAGSGAAAAKALTPKKGGGGAKKKKA